MVLVFGGFVILIFTSGGTDTGDRPTRDSHFDVLENDRDDILTKTVGIRKSGEERIASRNNLGRKIV